MAATLTREAMEQAIREGGSVLYNGAIITRLQDLPHEATLAQGDSAREAAAAATLDAQIAALLQQRAQLGTPVVGTEEQPEGTPAAGTQIGGDLPPVATAAEKPAAAAPEAEKPAPVEKPTRGAEKPR